MSCSRQAAAGLKQSGSENFTEMTRYDILKEDIICPVTLPGIS